MSFELPTRKSQDIKLHSFDRNGKETLSYTLTFEQTFCCHEQTCCTLLRGWRFGSHSKWLMTKLHWEFFWKVNWFKVSQKLVKERRLEGNFSCMDMSSNSFTWVNTQVFSISNRNSTFLANTYAINKQREVQFRFRVLLIRNRSSFLDFIDCLLMEKIESQQERYNNINSFKWVWLTELYVRHCKKVEPI